MYPMLSIKDVFEAWFYRRGDFDSSFVFGVGGEFALHMHGWIEQRHRASIEADFPRCPIIRDRTIHKVEIVTAPGSPRVVINSVFVVALSARRDTVTHSSQKMVLMGGTDEVILRFERLLSKRVEERRCVLLKQ
jgi:hypothetical protein